MGSIGVIVTGIRKYTSISRKVVGKSARDNPERYCGWFWVRCSSKKFERMSQEAVDVCLHVLKESNKRNFDSYSVRNSVLIISHITFQDCRVHIFADNLSQNRCIQIRKVTENAEKDGVDGFYLWHYKYEQGSGERICRLEYWHPSTFLSITFDKDQET